MRAGRAWWRPAWTTSKSTAEQSDYRAVKAIALRATGFARPVGSRLTARGRPADAAIGGWFPSHADTGVSAPLRPGRTETPGSTGLLPETITERNAGGRVRIGRTLFGRVRAPDPHLHKAGRPPGVKSRHSDEIHRER